MSIFKVLELESAVQVGDKTRLNGSKSYVAKQTSAISNVRIKPGLDGSYVSVYASNVDDWYLDYQFDSWTFDIDATNNKIDFKESSELVATLTGGTYTLATLLTEIKTKMEAAGSGTYTFTLDNDNRITVSADVDFELLPTGDNANVSLLPHIGFLKPTQRGSSVQGKPVEYSYKVINIEVTSGVSPSDTIENKDFYLKVYSEPGDRLFASDDDLRRHEKDISRWIVKGRNTHKDVHRRVQLEILEWLDGQGYTDIDGVSFTKWSFRDLSDIKEWATYAALRMIFDDLSNAVDDIFSVKSTKYSAYEQKARNRYIKLDIDNDSIVDEDEFLNIKAGQVYLR